MALIKMNKQNFWRQDRNDGKLALSCILTSIAPSTILSSCTSICTCKCEQGIAFFACCSLQSALQAALSRNPHTPLLQHT